MTTLSKESSADADWAVVVTKDFRATSRSPAVYFDDNPKRYAGENVSMTADLIEVDEKELLEQAFRQSIWFDGGREAPFSARELFLPPRWRSFANVPAFGMWANRKESDDEILNWLGSQWDGGGESQ